MKTILAPLFAAVLCVFLLAGCSSKKTIVGKWQADKNVQFEFTKEGKLLMNMGSVSMNASYSLPDDKHFTMEIDLGGKKESKTVSYNVDGDTLTTDDGNGKKQTLTRIK